MKYSLIKKMVACVSALSVLSTMSVLNVSAEITANPVISRDCPAYAGTGESTAYAANDAYYYSFWFGTAPTYLAYDLSSIPEEQREKVIAVWYNTSSAYDSTVGENYNSTNAMPTDYTIEVNSADGGTYPEDNWEVVETVKGNNCHSRQHAIDMKGYNWIRINITGVDGKESGSVGINMDIHNVSDGISDSWIFYGDSITACGMMNCYGTGFAEFVNQIDSRYFPVQENGGIGGIKSSHGAENIEKWLDMFPGKYVSIAYGTNDSWGNQTGAEKYYENTAFMVEEVLERGKIPVVPKIPYSLETGVSTYLDDYNAMIDKIYETYPEVIKGPDFYTLLKENPEYLSADGVHPNDDGYAFMRKTWAETMYKSVYSVENSENKGNEYDINNDEIVDIRDLKELKKYILGVSEYNSDMTVNDAVILCNMLLEK